MRRRSFLLLNLVPLAFFFCLLQIGCGGDGDDSGNGTPRPASITGNAILDLQLADSGTPPPPAPAGYTLLNVDLNSGTGGDYIWLYYKVGKADGSEGQPISKIYTVDEAPADSLCGGGVETPQGGTQLPVNLNAGSPKGRAPLWLYYTKSDWPVARCIVVDSRKADGSNHVRMYAPPEAEGQYQVVWVEQLTPGTCTSPYTSEGIPPHAQDLNEGESSLFYVSDYIYIGYCKD
jgi:hypothetical protein